MKKVLFLPLLQMPSGHHQVADALISSLEKRGLKVSCQKVDFLQYVNTWLEKAVTSTYIKWIHYAPRTYEWVYRNCACGANHAASYQLKWYRLMFRERMEQLLTQEQPDWIICTHAFPSFLVGELKEQGRIQVPVINVYTDFFANNIWGRQGIDYHFVPTVLLKNELISKYNIRKEQIYVTGIPVDEHFYHTDRKLRPSAPYKVLVSGGSNGLGNIASLLQKIKRMTELHYVVLCGSNEKLFREIVSWKQPHIQPLSFVSSRKQMSELYDQSCAVIGKPGGVTVSEALWKRVPIFIHSALPGQEEENLRYLESQKLVRRLCTDFPYETQIINVLYNEKEWNQWAKHMECYHYEREVVAGEKIKELIEVQ
jgi:processive 1,2-diacylglycerol beta-glucosyltransferase